jgi:hypothetical protein
LFLPEVPDKLADRIYAKHGIEPEKVDKARGFWFVVLKYNLPITITEGYKKTLASLSQGEVTIGLPGANGGYRSRNDSGLKLPFRELQHELAVFATPSREFRFALDQDTKISTILNVRRDMVRAGELLEKAGCVVKVLKWQGDKGLDDLIINQGPVAYALAQSEAVPLATEARIHYRQQYNRLAKQIEASSPGLTQRELDREVLRLAIGRGDLDDGTRFISQSDPARAVYREHGSEGVRAYLKAIGAVRREVTPQPAKVKELDFER